ncbi:hypothetical protein [Methylobacterium nodulans]|uniref:Uncharacterized protein n=1 Tax=Methylobacterium nodulans (strain LMG 21967 / CNCM I-2342 / ORS 2060) TaxID=460265 RepID=B8IRR0_METNO|nr:hypothetical protein [Methylobacterium nodulans]ACL60610.1 hypothetical protein Mnod_5781 [Methylobacterium nodulans ORS 2060]
MPDPRQPTRPFERRLARLVAEITAAASAYEARWTLAALHRVDAELHARLRRQIDLWLAASGSFDEDEIERQGGALVRGYRIAYARMGTEGVEDDAYLIGKDEASGLRIAIGDSPASADRVAELDPACAFFTPDEIAGLLHQLGGFRTIAAVKRAFPGALAQPWRPDPTSERSTAEIESEALSDPEQELATDDA